MHKQNIERLTKVVEDLRKAARDDEFASACQIALALKLAHHDGRVSNGEYMLLADFMTAKFPGSVNRAPLPVEEPSFGRDSMQYRALGNITPLLTYLQNNASTLLPDALPGSYLLDELSKVLPALVTDAGRMRGLRLIVCEQNIDLKLKMIDAVTGYLETQPDIAADDAPTVERLNEVIDGMLIAAHQARQS